MALFGLNNIALTAPLWLLALLPIALGLLAIYRRRGERGQTIVGSLLILSRIPNPEKPKNSRIPPWRFFFELLLALILLLAVGGLAYQEEQQQAALLVDNSLSMAAVNHKAPLPETLLASAIERASNALDTIPNNATVTLFTSAPQLREIAKSSSASDISEAFGQLRAEYAPDNLQATVAQLQERGFAKILVFTDKTLTEQTQSSNLVSEPIWGEQARSGAANVALSALTLAPAKSEANESSEQSILVELSSFGASSGTALLTVQPFGPNGEQLKATKLPVQLAPNTLQKDTVKVNLAGAVGVKASLEQIKPAEADWLKEDNERWLSLKSSQHPIVVISPFKLNELGLAALPKYSFVQCSPEDLLTCAKGARSAILHRVQLHGGLLKGLAGVGVNSAVVIMPNPKSSLLPADSACQDAALTTWREGDELLAYLTLAALKLPSCQTFSLKGTLPAWASALIDSTAGTVALTGKLEGLSTVVLGFELLPFQGRRSPFGSVLLLNSLKWLERSSANSTTLDTFAAVPESAKIIERLGHSSFSTVEANGSALALPGLYRLVNAEGVTTYEAVNFFSRDESDLKERVVSLVPPTPAASQARSAKSNKANSEQEQGQSLLELLAWLCIALLLLDLFAAGVLKGGSVALRWPLNLLGKKAAKAGSSTPRGGVA